MTKTDHLDAERGELWWTKHGDLVLVLKPVPTPPEDNWTVDALVHNISRHGFADIHPVSVTGSTLKERVRVGVDGENRFPYVREAESVDDLKAYHDALHALMANMNDRVQAIRSEMNHREE